MNLKEYILTKLSTNNKLIPKARQITWLIKNNHSTFLEEVDKQLPNLSNLTLGEKINCILQNIDQIPKCLGCGDFCKMVDGKWQIYCKLACRNKHVVKYGKDNNFSIHKDKIKNIIEEKYGVTNISKHEDIKKIKSERAKDIKYWKKSLDTYKNKTGFSSPFSNPEVRGDIFKTNMKVYGVGHPLKNKNILEKLKKTNLQKYGVDNPLKNKEIREKIIQTWLEKYGVDNPLKNKEIRGKIIQTWLEIYGVDNPLKIEEVKEKIKQTSLEKYGVDNPFKSEKFKEEIKTLWMEKYGVDNPFKSIEVRERIRQSMISSGKLRVLSNGMSISGYAQSKGINVTTAHSAFKKGGEQLAIDYVEKQKKRITTLEQYVKRTFDLDFYNKSPNGMFDGKICKPDFKINENTFLDADGLYWHSEKVSENKFRHFHRREWFERQGLRLYQFNEDQVYNKVECIKSFLHLGTYKNIRASKCSIVDLHRRKKEVRSFLNENHLQGYMASKYVGLEYNGELVSVFGYKRNFKGFLEISRFASKNFNNVHGAFSKLLKEVIRITGEQEIHSWCDLRYSAGKVYETNGFVKERETLGWFWTDGKQIIHRLKFQNKEGYERGLFKVYDAGQRLYIYRK